jgi:hypothetical protein
MTAEEWRKSRPGVLPTARYAEGQIRSWDKQQAGGRPAAA